MPFEPLRFIHAANCFLDCPVALPDDVSPAHGEVAATATIFAFRNLVQACLEHHVDFLLLCGNTFIDADRSLAARVALCDGLDRLDEAGMQSFVLPGNNDPAAAWHAIAQLPESVTVLADDDEPVAVLRDGRVIASIAPVGTSPGPAANYGASQRPVRIGVRNADGDWHGEPHDTAEHNPQPAHSDHALSPFLASQAYDFIALGGTARKGTLQFKTTGISENTACLEPQPAAGIIHHPGSTQPLRPGEGGSCTLVELDASQKFHLKSLPTAPLRFEKIRKSLDAGDTLENLLRTLPGKLTQHPTVSGELLRCVRWTVEGCGPLWDALQSPESRRRIEQELQREPLAGSPQIIHHIDTTPPTHGTERPDDSLVAEFQRALAELPQTPRRPADLLSQPAEERAGLEHLSGRLSPARIAALAERIGIQRLLPHSGRDDTFV